jgi:hypothetical protein
MDFVERLFGISPDGGSGQYEVTLVLLLLSACVLAVVLRRRLSRK